MIVPSREELTLKRSIELIVEDVERIHDTWNAPLWDAPEEAQAIMNAARLDWQIELARTLGDLVEPFPKDRAQAKTILGYATLGALVEGSLKVILSLWGKTYFESESKFQKGKRDNKKTKPPEELTLDNLRVFFAKEVWNDLEAIEWEGIPNIDWLAWIDKIRARRNCIHAFKDSVLGTQADLQEDIALYLHFRAFVSGNEPPTVNDY